MQDIYFSKFFKFIMLNYVIIDIIFDFCLALNLMINKVFNIGANLQENLIKIIGGYLHCHYHHLIRFA